MTVNILGTEWSIVFLSPPESEKLTDCDGYTDWTTQRIVVAVLEPDKDSVEDLTCYRNKVVRHEIVHAFLFEAGLGFCAGPAECWATNEEMVDWLAMQGPKICEAWKTAGAL